jgi:hypothetical protein
MVGSFCMVASSRRGIFIPTPYPANTGKQMTSGCSGGAVRERKITQTPIVPKDDFSASQLTLHCLHTLIVYPERIFNMETREFYAYDIFRTLTDP